MKKLTSKINLPKKSGFELVKSKIAKLICSSGYSLVVSIPNVIFEILILLK